MNDRSILSHSRLRAAGELGQQLWLDRPTPQALRALLETGGLAALIADDGLQGLIVAPAGFALPEVRQACDLLSRLHADSAGQAGLVAITLPLPPRPAHDTGAHDTGAQDAPALLAAARRLWQAIGRPNALIGLPATAAGIAALEEATFAGINIKLDLVFSAGQWRAARAAHCRGLARRLEAQLPVRGIASVVSVGIAPLDTAVDALLARGSAASADTAALRGRAAIAAARLAYKEWQDDAGFAVFAAFGAAPQRLLWSGMAPADPARREVRYAEALMGAGTIAALPASVLDAFRGHGVALPALETADAAAERAVLTQLAHLGIDLATLGADLLAAGLMQFEQAHDKLHV